MKPNVGQLAAAGDVTGLQSALRDGDASVRAEAARALASLATVPAMDVLVGAGRDGSADVEVWEALAGLEDPQWLDRLATEDLNRLFEVVTPYRGLDVYRPHGSPLMRRALHQRTAVIRAMVRDGRAETLRRLLRDDGRTLLAWTRSPWGEGEPYTRRVHGREESTFGARSRPPRHSAAGILSGLLERSAEEFSTEQLEALARLRDPAERWVGSDKEYDTDYRAERTVDYSGLRDAAARALTRVARTGRRPAE